MLPWNNQLIVVDDQDPLEAVHVPEDAIIHGGALVHFHFMETGPVVSVLKGTVCLKSTNPSSA